MPFHLIYVEDNVRDVKLLSAALEAINKNKPDWSMIKLTPVSHPSGLPKALEEQPDVVLADVFFDSPEVNRLDEIIKHIREWDSNSYHGFITPIIAYTKGVGGTLQNCFERRGELYDIWHKLSANPDYVAWRFQRLAAELPRYRPDATIQKLIASLPSAICPIWHKHVLTLVKKYGQGQTEHQQVINCRDSVQSILDNVDKDHVKTLMVLWDALTGSEPLLRAASPKLRGIARHSINVFWFGYWLINNPLLKSQMSKLWSDMLDRRSDVIELRKTDPIEGMNAIWVLASLFHDAGKFHEYSQAIVKKTEEFFSEFDQLGIGQASWKSGKADSLLKVVQQVLHQLSTKPEDPMTKALGEHIANCSEKEKPEHGAVAAAYLCSIAGVSKENMRFISYASEAARAVLIHSCLPAVYDALHKNEPADHLRVEWQRDPIASLLLFCDQIQTWDRHNPIAENQDYPDRAELSYLEVVPGKQGNKPHLKGCIDYIAPSRVGMYPELNDKIAESLNKVVLEKPKHTMLHVLQKHQWPFSVHFDCTLSGDELSIDMDFE